MILLPIAGNACEHVRGPWNFDPHGEMGHRNQRFRKQSTTTRGSQKNVIFVLDSQSFSPVFNENQVIRFFLRKTHRRRFWLLKAHLYGIPWFEGCRWETTIGIHHLWEETCL